VGNRQPRQRAVDPPAHRDQRRRVHRVLQARGTTTATRWRGATTRSKASWSTPRCCTCPAARRSTCTTAMRPRA
jgi:hypothetical protein